MVKVAPFAHAKSRPSMEYFRPYQAAVISYSLVVAVAAGAALSLFWNQYIPALALFAGCLIGLASLFHIAGSFDRLMKAGKGYVPFLSIEGALRVLLAGAAPFLIVGHGPWLGYFTYLAGFVAPLAVAILVYRQQVVYGRDDAAT
jgi:hypothetical protein